jgi:phosphopantothenoylcysteine decarboxylase/phosphopantothenate--cysteine ligase
VLVVGPNEGEMACGEFGLGRMAEPLEIVAAIEQALAGETRIPLPAAGVPGAKLIAAAPLAGRHVLVTAGPTHEPIDPVRYIANRSSGRQGYAIAEAAVAAGARVTLVSGPVSLVPPVGVTLKPVETAQEMLEAVEAALPVDIAVFAAAVADWRVGDAGTAKIK